MDSLINVHCAALADGKVFFFTNIAQRTKRNAFAANPADCRSGPDRTRMPQKLSALTVGIGTAQKRIKLPIVTDGLVITADGAAGQPQPAKKLCPGKDVYKRQDMLSSLKDKVVDVAGKATVAVTDVYKRQVWMRPAACTSCRRTPSQTWRRPLPRCV